MGLMRESIFVSFELGELIRKARKKQKTTQEDLALSLDISPSTVSNIERGAYQVAKDKFMAVCDFLGLEAEELLRDTEKEEGSPVDIRLLFKTIEHDMNLVGANEAGTALQKIKLAPDDPLLAEYYLLHGRIHEANRSWIKAQEFYEKAIHHADQFPILKNTNIKSINYYFLSRLFGRQNKLEQALTASRKGEECFIVGVGRGYLKYNLLLSRAVYLEKLNQNDEAFQITEELWENRSSFASTEAKTNLAQLQATLLNKFGLYEQAIYYAEEGLLLARLDKQFDRSVELWTTQGESYRKKSEFPNAKLCLQTALKLKQKIHHSSLAVSTYTQLGLLYLELNDKQKSQTILEQAVTLGEETKDNPRLMSALIALGD
jgi:transcriptional regulator with XRE-family HTH domain